MNGIIDKATAVFDKGTSYGEISFITTVTGIVLVFSMLLFLVFVLYLFGLIGTTIKKSAEKKQEKIKNELAKQFSNDPEPVASQMTETKTVENSNVISNEIIAVISAAVNEMYAGTGKKPVIKAVKKAGSRRSAWATAGLADNTRSF